MICVSSIKKYCTDYTKIENYDKAIADETQTWQCHHRDEIKILPSGIKVIRTPEELKENGRYYNCPPNELIFLTASEHRKLHTEGINNPNFGNKLNSEIKLKISNTLKGHKLSEETKSKISKSCSESLKDKPKKKSIFGNKYYEHFGYSKETNPKQYDKERHWYINHNNRCRWEK